MLQRSFNDSAVRNHEKHDFPQTQDAVKKKKKKKGGNKKLQESF